MTNLYSNKEKVLRIRKVKINVLFVIDLLMTKSETPFIEDEDKALLKEIKLTKILVDKPAPLVSA